MRTLIIFVLLTAVFAMAGCSNTRTLDEALKQRNIPKEHILYTHRDDEKGYAIVFQVISMSEIREKKLGYKIFVKKSNGWRFLHGGAKPNLLPNTIEYDFATFGVESGRRLGLIYGVSQDPTVRLQSPEGSKDIKALFTEAAGTGIWFAIFENPSSMNIPGLEVVPENK